MDKSFWHYTSCSNIEYISGKNDENENTRNQININKSQYHDAFLKIRKSATFGVCNCEIIKILQKLYK